MAELIPTFEAPDYMGQFASRIDKMDEGSGARLKAMLDARTEIAKGLMFNSEKLAGIGGSALPGQLAGTFGLDPSVWNTPMTGEMDKLRLAAARADIARASGGGGGGGGGSDGTKSDEMMIDFYDADGNHVGEEKIKANALDYWTQNSEPGIEVRVRAPRFANSSGGGAPAAAVADPEAAPDLATAAPHSNDVREQQRQMLEAGGYKTRATSDGGWEFKKEGSGDDVPWEPL